MTSMVAKRQLIIVGLILMKYSSWKYSVSAPNIDTTTIVMIGIIGSVLYMTHDIASAAGVTTISVSVAMNIGLARNESCRFR